MADYTELLQALANQQQQYAQSNPYLIGGQTILKTPVQTTEQSDPLQTALVQALQGFIGSAATAYGGQQAKQQGLQLGQKFQSALQSPDPTSALLADPELSDMGQIMMLQKASEEAAKTNKIAELRDTYKEKAKYEMPQAIDTGTTKEVYGRDPETGFPKLIKSIPTPEKLSAGEQPVNREMLNQLVEQKQIPKEVADTIKTYNDLNAVYRGQRMEGIQSRYEQTRSDKTELGVMASPIVDPETGKAQTYSETAKKEISETASGTATILRNVEELRKAIKEDGRITVGDANSKQGAIAARIFIAQRKLYNEGIRINEYIKDLDANALGMSIFAEHPLDAFGQVLTGVDSERALDNFGKEVASVMKDHLLARGAKPDPEKYSKYDPMGAAALKKYLGEQPGGDVYEAMVQEELQKLRAGAK